MTRRTPVIPPPPPALPDLVADAAHDAGIHESEYEKLTERIGEEAEPSGRLMRASLAAAAATMAAGYRSAQLAAAVEAVGGELVTEVRRVADALEGLLARLRGDES